MKRSRADPNQLLVGKSLAVDPSQLVSGKEPDLSRVDNQHYDNSSDDSINQMDPQEFSEQHSQTFKLKKFDMVQGKSSQVLSPEIVNQHIIKKFETEYLDKENQNSRNPEPLIRISSADQQQNFQTNLDDAKNKIVEQKIEIVNQVDQMEKESNDLKRESNEITGKNQSDKKQGENDNISGSSEDSSNAPQEEEHQIINYNLWNHHPLVAIVRSIKYHRRFIWQSHFISLFSFTLHIYLVMLVMQYDIYVAINGNQDVKKFLEVPLFILFSVIAVLISWPVGYAFGALTILFKKDVIVLEESHEESRLKILKEKLFYSQQLSVLYWFIFVPVIILLDFLISWRGFYYSNGTPDYWVASAFFCPIFDLILFETIFLFGIAQLLGRKPLLEVRIIDILRIKGYIQTDLYYNSKQQE